METHTAVGELLGPDLGEGHLGPFGPGVLLGAPVGVGRTGAAHLEAVDGEAGGVHAARRHGQDAGGPFDRSVGRSRAVSRNGPSTWEATVLSMPSAFSVRSALSAPALWMRVSRSSCEPITVSASAATAARSPRSAYRGVWVAPVGEEGCAGGVGLGRIAADDEQRGAEPGEAMGCGKAEARCGAREQDGAPGEVVVVEVGPVLGARTDDRADAGETRSDRRLEDPIEQLCAHATAAPSRTRMRPAAALSPMRLKTSPRRGSRRASGPRSSSVAS